MIEPVSINEIKIVDQINRGTIIPPLATSPPPNLGYFSSPIKTRRSRFTRNRSNWQKNEQRFLCSLDPKRTIFHGYIGHNQLPPTICWINNKDARQYTSIGPAKRVRLLYRSHIHSKSMEQAGRLTLISQAPKHRRDKNLRGSGPQRIVPTPFWRKQSVGYNTDILRKRKEKSYLISAAILFRLRHFKDFNF